MRRFDVIKCSRRRQEKWAFNEGAGFARMPPSVVPMDKTQAKRISIDYGGHVQGVGFRYRAESLAARFPVTGYVQNLSDGRVRLVAEGGEQHLAALMNEIKQSHLGRLISEEDTVWSAATGEFKDFSVRYGY